jgi:hypothetical protein
MRGSSPKNATKTLKRAKIQDFQLQGLKNQGFLEKPQTKEIIKNIKKGNNDICKIVGCSNKTIIKTKRLCEKHNVLLNNTQKQTI